MNSALSYSPQSPYYYSAALGHCSVILRVLA
jgi:hypothetical protein